MVSEQFQVKNLNVILDFATSPASAGEVIWLGKDAAYYWEEDNTTHSENYETDRDTVLEVTGIQTLGPFVADNNPERVKIESIKFKVGGATVPGMVFNELMAPYNYPGAASIGPTEFWKNGTGFCTNVGQPVTWGGPNWSPTVKVGPLSDLGIEVVFPRTTDGGQATIDHVMRLRLSFVEIKSEAMLKRLLAANTAYDSSGTPVPTLDSAGTVNQSWQLIDVEGMKYNYAPKAIQNFTIDDWTSMNGGLDASTPRIERYITYSKNAAATTTNKYYEFELDNNKVNNDYNELDWNLENEQAVQITHMGIVPDTNLANVKLYKSSQSNPLILDVTPAYNPFPAPVARWKTDDPIRAFPLPLERPFLLWGEKGNITMKDNGTSIPASNANTPGVEVQIWGYKHYLPRA